MSNNLIIINAHIVTPQGRTARKGEAMNELLNIPCGTVRVTDGIITYVGENRISHEKPGYKVLDARGNVLLPGFVDSHTHLVFGGFRPDEFIWRLNGDSYMSIMERGGGIINTVRATREASFEELKHKAEWFLDTMSRMGVTTVEGKSGYGLDRDTELKQLSIMQAINECPDRKVDIATTFLGAHALPEEYKGRSDAYIDFLINEMLPMIHQKQLAENCDIFCEKGVFTVEQSRKLLKAAQALGFGAKLHADEIVSFGGAELAGELKALSADHLLQASDEGIKALAQNNVVATKRALRPWQENDRQRLCRSPCHRSKSRQLFLRIHPADFCSGLHLYETDRCRSYHSHHTERCGSPRTRRPHRKHRSRKTGRLCFTGNRQPPYITLLYRYERSEADHQRGTYSTFKLTN